MADFWLPRRRNCEISPTIQEIFSCLNFKKIIMRNPYRVNFAYLYPEMMFELISLNILHSMINVLFIVEL